MSQSTAKATRRDLRRAVGPAALETVQQHENAVVELRMRMLALEQAHNAMARKVEDLERDAIEYQTAVNSDIDALMADSAALSMSFRTRLRWLLTGTMK